MGAMMHTELNVRPEYPAGFTTVCKGLQFYAVRLADMMAVSDDAGKPKPYGWAEDAFNSAGADLERHGVVPFVHIPVCQGGKHTGSIIHPV